MIEYVAGFMFNKEMTKVALIEKIKPEWQRGFLNGIGGKIEQGEVDIDAMCREFEEETGYKTFYYDWKYLTKLAHKGLDWTVHFFFCNTLLDSFEKLETTTEERVVVIDISNLDNEKVIPNLKWLIRMCFDKNIVRGQISYK